ncbi:MAG TPA: hypothetical protein PK826_11755, partial [Anaerolineae bacterium]|nr:hypothetical protein [Anaerolineae bacterium]
MTARPARDPARSRPVGRNGWAALALAALLGAAAPRELPAAADPRPVCLYIPVMLRRVDLNAAPELWQAASAATLPLDRCPRPDG